jgi:hypothetical protein
MKPIRANRLNSIVLTFLDILADSDNWLLSLLLLRDVDGGTTTTFLSLVSLAEHLMLFQLEALVLLHYHARRYYYARYVWASKLYNKFDNELNPL